METEWEQGNIIHPREQTGPGDHGEVDGQEGERMEAEGGKVKEEERRRTGPGRVRRMDVKMGWGKDKAPTWVVVEYSEEWVGT